jgi:hypothetical protein
VPVTVAGTEDITANKLSVVFLLTTIEVLLLEIVAQEYQVTCLKVTQPITVD